MTHRKTKRRTLTALVGVAALSLTAACSSGETSSGSGAQSGADARGPITFVTGKDNSGVWPPTIEKWNAAHPNEKVTLKEQSDHADQQHDDIVQHFQAKDASYDVVTVDVVWTRGVRRQGLARRRSRTRSRSTPRKLLKPPVEAATYNGTLYAAPFASDGGDALLPQGPRPHPAEDLDEMWAMCSIAKKNDIGCYAGQFAKYEGLTVNASEAINTVGGKVVDDKGKATVDSPEAARACR